MSLFPALSPAPPVTAERFGATRTASSRPELSGYLMSRPKNAVSGSAALAGATYGFVTVRYE